MQLEVGSIYEGKVTGITSFGVFVELEKNTTGMVHISEISTSFVNDINEFVKIGDTVKVKVLALSDNGKISLSMRKAMEQPNDGKPRGQHYRNDKGDRRPERGDRGDRNDKNDGSPYYQKRERAPRDNQRRGDDNRFASFKGNSDGSGDSFEDMMAKFKQSSDEKFMDLKRKTGGEGKRSRRGSGNKIDMM